MKPRSILVLVVVLVVSGACVRLGFWQISRWHEKQALNAALRSGLERAPLSLRTTALPLDSLRGRRVSVTGVLDETHHVLLSGRANNGSPGVNVVTPLVVGKGSSAVLVNRGWLYAPDAATARAQDYPEPGELDVVGIAEGLRRGSEGPPMRTLESDSTTLLSARWLDFDSLSLRLPYAIAPFVIRQLPGPGVPDIPLRTPPRPLDESMHLSYAVQWFLFAAILLGGSAAVAWSGRRGRREHVA